MTPTPDVIDRLLAAWADTRPDLDATPLALVGRVIVLASHLERSVAAALAPHGLDLRLFDILATLRRHGPAGGLTPGELCESVMLSSGGMTPRLDRLVKDGLAARTRHPTDRRQVVVELTPKGKMVIDAATETRFREANVSLPPLPPAGRARLEGLLRAWLGAVAG